MRSETATLVRGSFYRAAASLLTSTDLYVPERSKVTTIGTVDYITGSLKPPGAVETKLSLGPRLLGE